MKNDKKLFIALIIVVFFVLNAAAMEKPNKPVLAEAEKKELNQQLLVAAGNGDADTMQALIEQGADINTKSKWGSGPLHYAAWNGNVDAVRLLLDKGANPNVKNDFRGTSLRGAMRYGNIEVLTLLLNYKKAPFCVHTLNELRKNQNSYLSLLHSDLINELSMHKNTFIVTDYDLRNAVFDKRLSKRMGDNTKQVVKSELAKRKMVRMTVPLLPYMPKANENKNQSNCIIS